MVSGQTVTDMPQQTINDAIQDFLHNRLDSLVKWDLIRFFNDNPHTKDTAENIARYTGRDVANIEQELKELVAAEVLQIEQIAGMTLYELAADARVRQTINRFMEACHDRTFRTRAIYHVIQRMHHARRHQ